MRTPESRAARGSALLPAMVVAGLMLALCAAVLTPVPRAISDVSERIGRTKSRYGALGAAARARWDLQRGGAGTIASGVPLGAIGQNLGTALAALEGAPDGSSFAETTQLQDGSYRIDAYAKVQAVIEGVTEIVRRGAQGAGQFAAFSASGTTTGVIFADSWDSSLGPYGAAAVNTDSAGNRFARENGAVASNGSISLGGGAIHGNATPGPGGTLTSGGATVYGSSAPAAAAVAAAPVRYTAPSQNDNAALDDISKLGVFSPKGGNTDVGTGSYVVSGVSILGGASVRVTGDAVFYSSGDVMLASARAAFTIAPGASLTIYTTGNVSIFGQDEVQNKTGAVTEGIPAKLQIFVGKDPAAQSAPTVTIANGGAIFGTIYAPESPVVLTRVSGGLFGSVVGDTIVARASTSVALHFDESLRGGGGGLPTTYQVFARWWASP